MQSKNHISAKSIKHLSQSEEYNLLVLIKNGDENAKTRLIKANQGLVYSIASSFLKGNVPNDDLISEGNQGLLKAIQKFDLSKETRFSTYAHFWIKKYIRKARLVEWGMIMLPEEKVELIIKIKKAISVLEERLHKTPYSDEIADLLKIDQKQVQQLLNYVFNDAYYSLDLLVNDGDNDKYRSLQEILEDTEYINQEDKLIQEETIRSLISGLNQLPSNYKLVIEMYYGIGMDKAHTLEEIAKKMSLSIERIRQIKEGGLKKLRLILINT